jgi:Fe-S cluster biogenesis protein NfuA
MSASENRGESKPKVPVSLSLTPKRPGEKDEHARPDAAAETDVSTDSSEYDDEVERRLLEVLESVREAIRADGGDIVYKGIRNGVVRLQLIDCQTCLIPDVSVKEGLERILKSRVEGIREVETV